MFADFAYASSRITLRRMVTIYNLPTNEPREIWQFRTATGFLDDIQIASQHRNVSLVDLFRGRKRSTDCESVFILTFLRGQIALSVFESSVTVI